MTQAQQMMDRLHGRDWEFIGNVIHKAMRKGKTERAFEVHWGLPAEESSGLQYEEVNGWVLGFSDGSQLALFHWNELCFPLYSDGDRGMELFQFIQEPMPPLWLLDTFGEMLNEPPFSKRH